MLKKKKLIIAVAAVFLLAALVITLFLVLHKKQTYVAERKVLGTDGYGAIFNAQIDPFDENCFAFTCDMGSLYFSYDTGKTFTRHNLRGVVYDVEFDMCKDGVVWAVGSGVYKSTDHGQSVKMVFPAEDEVTSAGFNFENSNYWIYSDGKSDYIPQYQIWSMCINRKNSDNVFVCQRVPVDGMGKTKGLYIYQTTDGEHFSFFTRLDYCFNYKLAYDESNDCLVVVTSDKFYEINSNGDVVWQADMSVYIQHKNGNSIAFDSCYNAQTGSNTFVFSLCNTGYEHAEMACYKTNNLRDSSTYIDLVKPLVGLSTDDLGVELTEQNKGLHSYEYHEWIGKGFVKHEFPWKFVYMSVLSDDVVYLYHEATIPLVNGSTRRTLAYIKYDQRKPADQRYQWVYGMPHKPVKQEENYSWQDSDSGFCFEFSSTPQNENALLIGTITSLFYTPDCNKIYQLESTVLSSDQLTATSKDGTTKEFNVQRTVTTGIDVICTHRVETDPFDSNHILMSSSDIGLIHSFDNGESWYHALYAWQDGSLISINYSEFANTCYDLHFDREKPGVVYSIWSRKQMAPYAPDSSFFSVPGRFGISYDGGISWYISEIAGDGAMVPYRMQVVYNGDQRTIYIATSGKGFFVSYDSGANFTPLNDGIEPSYFLGANKPGIYGSEILSCKMGLFAVTGAVAHYSDDQKLYRWNESFDKFESIPLPENIAAVRDIVYDEKNNCLYLAAIAKSLNNYSQLVQDGGGVWKYADGKFTQIYDATVSVFGVNLDSKGRLYATVYDGAIVRFDNNNTTYEVLIEGMFHKLKNISFGADDNVLYVTSMGGGTERLILKQK